MSHNFISLEVVEKLKISIESQKNFTVIVGDGHEVQGQSMCKGVNLKLQGLEVTQLLSLSLGRLKCGAGGGLA